MNIQEFNIFCVNCGEQLILTKKNEINKKIHIIDNDLYYHKICHSFVRNKTKKIPKYSDFGLYL